MTESLEPAESKVALAGESAAWAAKRPAPTRSSDSEWVEWCDADR